MPFYTDNRLEHSTPISKIKWKYYKVFQFSAQAKKQIFLQKKDIIKWKILYFLLAQPK